MGLPTSPDPWTPHRANVARHLPPDAHSQTRRNPPPSERAGNNVVKTGIIGHCLGKTFL